MRIVGHGRSHTHFLVGLSWKKLAFPALILFVFPGVVAYAFSVSALWNGITDFTKVIIQDKIPNSQNLALAAGPEFVASDTPSDVNTVAGSALLPDSGPTGGMADVSDYDHGQISTYVVREGDTFARIATMFDVSVSTILWANNLPSGSKLTVGETLVILPVSGVQYSVKKGDTIAGVAKKFKGDPDEIRSYNGILPGDTLEVGSIVIIPDGELPAATATYSPATSKVHNAGGPSYDGYYRAPLSSYIKTQGLHGYNGVDLVSTQGYGAPVMAAAGGQVVIARQGGYNGGYGTYVVIQHGNGTQTLYGHLKSVAVAAGDVVFQGEVIGYEGNTGRTTGRTGIHLHFEVRGARNPFNACPLGATCGL